MRDGGTEHDWVDSPGGCAWMVASVGASFFIVLVVLDLPLCTRWNCTTDRGWLGTALVCLFVLLLGVGVPLLWWRLRRVGGRP